VFRLIEYLSSCDRRAATQQLIQATLEVNDEIAEIVHDTIFNALAGLS